MSDSVQNLNIGGVTATDHSCRRTIDVHSQIDGATNGRSDVFPECPLRKELHLMSIVSLKLACDNPTFAFSPGPGYPILIDCQYVESEVWDSISLYGSLGSPKASSAIIILDDAKKSVRQTYDIPQHALPRND